MPGKLLLFTCFFISINSFSQQYPFVHYTPKDGLVNSRVRKAYQDSKGRMYFITYGGLSVYDGARFKNYTTQNGLLTDLVNDVLEVGEDSLLVAVNTCGLNVLVRGQMKQIHITRTNCPVINQFLKSKDGNIYATADDGLYILRPTGFEKLPALVLPEKEPAIYLGIVAEYKDFLVFTTNDLKSYRGLYLYNKKTNTITDVLLKIIIHSLKSDYAGIIWLSTDKAIAILDTLALVKGKLELRKPYASRINEQSLTPGNIDFNRENELMISSGSKGITRYRKDGTLLHIASPELSTTVVQNSFTDREDVLWISHDGNGVYKLPNTKLQSTSTSFDENKSGIRTVNAAADDSCWIVMNNREWILQTSSKSKNFHITPSFDANVISNSKTYLYAADLHNLYITMLSKENQTTLHFKKILTLPDTASFGGLSVTDPYGNLITFESRNIIVVRGDQKVFAYPFPFYDLIEGMHIDKDNRLWIASRSIGLMVFSLHPEDTSGYLKKEFQFIKEFETASPRHMAVDQNELMWVGTRYHGLIGFEYKNNQLKKLYHFQTHNGLTDNFITSLACDKNNNVIVGTQTGLDRLIKTKEGYRPENVTKSNNIFSYINYVWTDRDNNAFAWTNTGAVFRVEPVQSVINTVEPQLLIEEMKVNGQLITQLAAPLRLKYFQRNISFSVAAPSFIDEKQIKYSYLLSGSGNTEWSDTSSVADINLLNLASGNYTLKVKAFFLSTAYTPKETSFSFIILAPWWQTWWFRIGIGISGIGVLVSGIRFYYRRKLEKQKNILERKQAVEKERTRIATDMHDDLGAGLSRIKFLSETIGIKKQRQQSIDEDVTRIRAYSHEMIDKMGEIVWALNEKNDSLNDLLAYTRAYAVEYLSQNGIRCNAEADEQPSSIFVSGEFRRNVYLTVKEALHNVVKHAQASSVSIKIVTGRELNIQIQDNGMGFDKNNIRPFSNGLVNMEKRIKEIGGRFSILNEKGTLVKISVPLPG